MTRGESTNVSDSIALTRKRGAIHTLLVTVNTTKMSQETIFSVINAISINVCLAHMFVSGHSVRKALSLNVCKYTNEVALFHIFQTKFRISASLRLKAARDKFRPKCNAPVVYVIGYIEVFSLNKYTFSIAFVVSVTPGSC